MVLALVVALVMARDRSEVQALQQVAPREARILFDSNRDGNFEIYVMDADGSNQRRLTNSEGSEGAAWSPDRKRVAFTTSAGSIAVMDVDFANPHVLIRTEGEESGGPIGGRPTGKGSRSRTLRRST